jgi:hypothetical protein
MYYLQGSAHGLPRGWRLAEYWYKADAVLYY